MDLHLDIAERDLLERVLRGHLGDLRMQIADTDTSTFRDQLRQEKAVLLRILEELGVDATAG
jgi:hypothetical protein